MDEAIDSSEYDLEISSKNWNKVSETHVQAGFIEGVEEGRNNSFQNGFDMGYAEGFSVGHTIGIIKGILSFTTDDHGNSSQYKEDRKKYEPLQNPLVDICQLCKGGKLENNVENAVSDSDIAEIMSRQRKLSTEKIEELKDQHAELFKKLGIVIEDIISAR